MAIYDSLGDRYGNTVVSTLAHSVGVITGAAINTSGIAAINTSGFTAINAHGIKYKSQTFEDRPTLFGSPLRIQWSVDELDLVAAYDHHAFDERLISQNTNRLKRAIRQDCADCLECPKCDIKVRQERSPIYRVTQFTVQALCRSERQPANMIVCPNGKAAVIKGSTALVPEVNDMPRRAFTEIPATEAPTGEPEPYIRATSPDTPMTAADEAW